MEAPLTAIQKSEIAFSDLLRTYRISHGYSQRKFAELINTTQSNICHWERCDHLPCMETQQAIRNKLESGEFNA